MEHIHRAGLDGSHTLMETFGYLALPELLHRGEQVKFAYIDGWHTFDSTLLDFWYLDRMLGAGGIVAFNDCGLAAVHRVLSFVRTTGGTRRRRWD